MLERYVQLGPDGQEGIVRVAAEQGSPWVDMALMPGELATGGPTVQVRLRPADARELGRGLLAVAGEQTDVTVPLGRGGRDGRIHLTVSPGRVTSVCWVGLTILSNPGPLVNQRLRDLDCADFCAALGDVADRVEHSMVEIADRAEEVSDV